MDITLNGVLSWLNETGEEAPTILLRAADGVEYYLNLSANLRAKVTPWVDRVTLVIVIGRIVRDPDKFLATINVDNVEKAAA
jgi:hypothetical protein